MRVPDSIRSLLASRSLIGPSAPRAVIKFLLKSDGTVLDPPLEIKVSNLRISREQAALAQRCTFEWPNVNPNDKTDVGYYSPDRGVDDPTKANEWMGVVMPGTGFTVSVGYGSELAQVFLGLIDDVEISAEPGNYLIRVDARDLGARLVDNAVEDQGIYSLTYTNMDVSDVVHDLLLRAGISSINTTERTGIAVAKTFTEESYADAIQWCMDVTGFELTIDEQGNASWHYPTDRQPEAKGEPVLLANTTKVKLQGSTPVVLGSEVVRSSTDPGATIYQRDIDYQIDYGTGEIWRLATGSIPSGSTVFVDYVYAAYVFQEGRDLFSLGYRITRKNVYGRIRVVGGEELQPDGTSYDPPRYFYGMADFVGSEIYGRTIDNVLFSQIPELDSYEKCTAAATQMLNDMAKRVRETNWASVGVPWVQVGDCVQVVETSSTISEVYRITSLDLELSESGFVMSGTAYHYGFAPVIVEEQGLQATGGAVLWRNIS